MSARRLGVGKKKAKRMFFSAWKSQMLSAQWKRVELLHPCLSSVQCIMYKCGVKPLSILQIIIIITKRSNKFLSSCSVLSQTAPLKSNRYPQLLKEMKILRVYFGLFIFPLDLRISALWDLECVFAWLASATSFPFESVPRCLKDVRGKWKPHFFPSLCIYLITLYMWMEDRGTLTELTHTAVTAIVSASRWDLRSAVRLIAVLSPASFCLALFVLLSLFSLFLSLSDSLSSCS